MTIKTPREFFAENRANEAAVAAVATGNEGRAACLVPGLQIRAGHVVAGQYAVEELVASEPSGVVLSATQTLTRRPVILHLIASYTELQVEANERRLARAKKAARLRGEHLVPIVDVGRTEDGMPYVAMDRPEGRTLDVELAERRRLPYPEAVRWILEACEGIAQAHAIGLVHGGLKPRTLLLAAPRRSSLAATTPGRSRDRRTLKVLDLGMATAATSFDPSVPLSFESAAYLSPEQIRDPHTVGARADVWALGAILHELISGKVPFAAESASSVMVSILIDTPALLTDAPYELARVVLRCLSKEPHERPRDVAELARELAPFAEGDGIVAAERIADTLPTDAPEACWIDAVSGVEPHDDGSMPPMSLPNATRPLSSLGLRPGWKTQRAAGEDSSPITQPSARIRRRRRTRTMLWVGAGVGLAMVTSLVLARRSHGNVEASTVNDSPVVQVGARVEERPSEIVSETAPPASKEPTSEAKTDPKAASDKTASNEPGPTEASRSTQASPHKRRPAIVRTPPWPDPARPVPPPVVTKENVYAPDPRPSRAPATTTKPPTTPSSKTKPSPRHARDGHPAVQPPPTPPAKAASNTRAERK